MRWSKSHFKSSFMALLGSGSRSAAADEDRLEAVREFILSEMGEFGEAHYPKVARRVRYAQDAQGLWYTRGDVMTVLAAEYGEAVASEKLITISNKFKGLLPRSLSSRPSPLTPMN